MVTKEVNLDEIETIPDCRPEEIKPTSLTLDITHSCPFNCLGCIEAKAMRHSKHTSLHADHVCRIIKQFSEQGGTEILLYGGEPTFHPYFDRIILFASTYIKKIRVVSNGAFLINPNIYESLYIASEQSDITVRVSLNAGSSKTHESLHGIKGYFYQVLDGLKTITDSKVDIGISFLIEGKNAHEILPAYEIAQDLGASVFWLRSKTGLHSRGIIPLSLSARKKVLEAIYQLKNLNTISQITFRHDPWYVHFLETNALPDTAKFYPSCYYCAASRLVITPPDPGLVWSCTSWRSDPRFYVASLNEIPFSSKEFERKRIDAINRIYPPRDCANVICNKNDANKVIWAKNIKMLDSFLRNQNDDFRISKKIARHI